MCILFKPKALFCASLLICYGNIVGPSAIFSPFLTLSLSLRHTQDYKEHIDAEGLMPLPTSDLQLEMRALREVYQQFSVFHNHEHQPHSRPKHQLSQTSHGSQTSGRPSVAESNDDKLSAGAGSELSSAPIATKALNLSPALIPQRNQQVGEVFSFKDFTQPGPLTDKHLNKSADLASLDSSDTYASCQTHPCLSQGDLASADLLDCTDEMLYDFDATGARTGSIMDFLDYESANTLYVNPLQKSDSDALKLQKKLSASSMGIRGNMSTGASPRAVSLVKKSASGGFGTPGLGGNGSSGKYGNVNDLVPMSLAKASSNHRVRSNNNSGRGSSCSNSQFRQRDESVNLIDGMDVPLEATGYEMCGVPKHRKTRFQQQTSSANPNDLAATASPNTVRKPGETALTTANLITVSQLAAQDGLFMGKPCEGGMSTSSGGSSSTITGSQVSVEPATSLTPSASVKVKCRRASFMPARSLASATKKINQHLFGGGCGSGSVGSAVGVANVLVLGSGSSAKKDSSKKALSLSNDSLDSDATTTTAVRLGSQQQLHQQSPRLDVSSQHRRSKSILKNKGERLPNKFDPENERLLMDSTAAPDDGVGCDCEYSPQRTRTLIHAKSAAALSMSGSATRPVFVHQRSIPDSDATSSASPKATTAKYKLPRHTETELATIRQHRQQKSFMETTLQGRSFGK